MGKIAFVLAGQGAQYTGMGRALYDASPAARAVLDAAESVRPGTLSQCFEGDKDTLSRTRNTQPCLFAVDLACARALEAQGVRADACAGFSLGDLAAAAYSGLLTDADESEIAAQQKATREIAQRLPLAKLNLTGFGGENLNKLFDSKKWPELSEACLGCGTCTFVCPTCQCYDIRDFDNGKSVTRYRCWDSCMYSDFTLMAAENSRHTQLQRYRQRFMHKLVYFPANNEGVYSCVGCGRCVEKCPQGLNIVRVIKALGVNEK